MELKVSCFPSCFYFLSISTRIHYMELKENPNRGIHGSHTPNPLHGVERNFSVYGVPTVGRANPLHGVERLVTSSFHPHHPAPPNPLHGVERPCILIVRLVAPRIHYMELKASVVSVSGNSYVWNPLHGVER